MRWILVDRFLEFDGATSARAIKNVSMGEDFSSHHFPGLPIYPASLLIESLAQTGGILVARAEGFKRKVILAKVERAEFSGHARPGDTIELTATVVERREEGFKVEGRASVGGRLLAVVVLMFVNLSGHQAGAELPGNFVFSKEFLGLFRGVDAPLEGAAVDDRLS